MATLIEQSVRSRLIRLLPGILASKAEPPKHFVVAAGVHYYAGEVASAVAGWGISNPLILVISGKDAQLAGTSGLVLAFALAWTVFILWFKRSKVADRLSLWEACKKAFAALESEIHKVLRQDDSPLSALIQMGPRLEEAMTQHKDGFFSNPNDASFSKAGNAEADKLVEQYGQYWQDHIRTAMAAE